MGRGLSLGAKLRRLKELTARERQFLLSAMVMLPFSVLALRLVGLQRYQRWLNRGRIALKPALNCDPVVAAKQASRMVNIAARYGLVRATCLPQSLTLAWLMRRMGQESQLQIGVRKENEVLKAHAWVEWQGYVLNDAADVTERFAAFPEAISPTVLRAPSRLAACSSPAS